MLVKSVFKIPGQRKLLLVMPDLTMYTVRSTIDRKIRPSDLKPVTTSLTADEYVQSVCAEKVEIRKGKQLNIWLRTVCLTSSPLQAARMDKGLTQQQLSDLSGVSIRDIQNIESFVSSPGNVSVRTILLLAQCLHVEPRYLLQEI